MSEQTSEIDEALTDLRERVEAALPTAAEFDRQRRRIRAIYTSAADSGYLLGTVNAVEALATKVREALASESSTPPATTASDDRG